MSRAASLVAVPGSTPTWAAMPRRLVLAAALAGALAACVVLAAWAANADVPAMPAPPAPVALLLPAGSALDHVLDEAGVSPTQRAQTHQIFDAADAGLRRDRAVEGADRDEMARLFAQPRVDASAVEAVRARLEARHDAASRRLAQAIVDVSLVLSPDQRQRIARRLAAGPPVFAVARASLPVSNE